MSVSVDICKDVEKYKETVIGGFDLKQSVSLIGGLLSGGIIGAACVFMLHVPMMFVAYIIMLVAIPFMLIGFANKDGMGFFERVKKTRMLKQCCESFYASTESEEAFAVLRKQQEAIAANEEKKENDFDLYMAKMKKIILSGIVFVLIAAAIIIILIIL